MNKTFILGAALFLSQKTLAAINKDVFNFAKPKSIVVAVIDTGADIEHDDLKNFIWTNEGETGLDIYGNNKETNQIDDDGNGFADDVHGWNFINNTNDVSDQVGHGTHVSGIIKKEYLSHTTSRTYSPSVRLMILKYFNPKAKAEDNLVNSINAIKYANKMRAQVINYSGGGAGSDVREQKAIEQSAKQNIVFVAAAGNNKSNTDVEKYYPANYSLMNIISVAAANNHGDLVGFSNYGSRIDIAAPGNEIYSALPNKKYGLMSGTSQATAFVTGIVASLIANRITRPEHIRTALKTSGTLNRALKGKIRTQTALLADVD
jgi:subtilisin family serine protease